MKKRNIFLIAALAVSLTFVGCGKKSEEAASNIKDITIEAEDLPAKPQEEAPAPEAEGIVDNEAPPEAGYVRSSLTNLWVPEETANSRPIAVMMPIDKVAQPQFGIGSAGVLYEALEEGGMSRQMAIIEGWQNLEKIGNIRSIRSYYVWIGAEWDAIQIHFGGPYYAVGPINHGAIDNISGTSVGGGTTHNTGKGVADAFFRTSDKAAPHNAYTSAELINKVLPKLGYDANHRDQYWKPDHFTFTNASNPNTLDGYSSAQTANVIDLSKVFPSGKSRLEYNAEEGVYYKSLYKEKQIDQLTGEQLTFENVIIQKTTMQTLDAKGYKDFVMVDSGKTGYFCTKGKAIPITWVKAHDLLPTKYYDENGKEIVLNTGKTFIAIASDDTEPIFE